jgi:hypothetical protein
VDVYPTLVAAGIPILIYNGDADGECVGRT